MHLLNSASFFVMVSSWMLLSASVFVWVYRGQTRKTKWPGLTSDREEKEENRLYSPREHGSLGKYDLVSSLSFFKTLGLLFIFVGVVLYECFKQDSLHRDH